MLRLLLFILLIVLFLYCFSQMKDRMTNTNDNLPRPTVYSYITSIGKAYNITPTDLNARIYCASTSSNLVSLDDRRFKYEDGVYATYNIYNILDDKNYYRFFNFILNRALVIKAKQMINVNNLPNVSAVIFLGTPITQAESTANIVSKITVAEYRNPDMSKILNNFAYKQLIYIPSTPDNIDFDTKKKVVSTYRMQPLFGFTTPIEKSITITNVNFTNNTISANINIPTNLDFSKFNVPVIFKVLYIKYCVKNTNNNNYTIDNNDYSTYTVTTTFSTVNNYNIVGNNLQSSTSTGPKSINAMTCDEENNIHTNIKIDISKLTIPTFTGLVTYETPKAYTDPAQNIGIVYNWYVPDFCSHYNYYFNKFF